MKRERLYMVHGTGPDRVGLVGTITTAVAQAGGNIVDLRQDVLHGLFTIFMVVDLSDTTLRVAELEAIVRTIAEDTGLELRVDKFAPVPRNPAKKNMLVVLIGRDKPGIIASISEKLGKYHVNIEFAQNIARENVFLMELLTDVSHCTLPLGNVQDTVRKAMAAMDITAIFQTEDVFNKRKRVVLFDLQSGFLDHATVDEVLQQTGLSAADLAAAFPSSDAQPDTLGRAASLLEGFPADVLSRVADAITPTPGTVELLQTLRTMGYSIAVRSPSFAPFVDAVGSRLGIGNRCGVGLPVDHDSRTVTGEIEPREGLDLKRTLAGVCEREEVSRENVTVVAGTDRETLGIRMRLDLGVVLDLYNKRVVSREGLLGILGGLGVVGVMDADGERKS